MKIKSILICGLCLLLGIAFAAQAENLPAVDTEAPVEVTADRLEASDATKTLVFIGHAVARQGDIEIAAERLTVHYSSQSNDVERVVAEQDVRIVQAGREATGDKAVFYRDLGKIVLTGRPQVKEGENWVAGDSITLSLKDKSSIVEGGQTGRVKAVFQPRAEN